MNPLAPLLLLGLVLFLQGAVVVKPRVVPEGLELQLGAQPILQRSGPPKHLPCSKWKKVSPGGISALYRSGPWPQVTPDCSRHGHRGSIRITHQLLFTTCPGR